MKQTVKCLTSLIRSVITDEKIEYSEVFEERFDKIMRLANFHEVQPLAAAGFLSNGLLKDEKQIAKCRDAMIKASYMDSKNEFTCRKASDSLNSAQIPFIKLKGAVIKNLYPETFLRTSCDTDILVRKNDFNRALSALKSDGFEQDGKIGYHDVSLLFDGTNLELHFSICENIKKIDALLKDIWKYTVKDGDYNYKEDNDYFAFHHIAHMLYHFFEGGCGIRPFVDLWIMRRNEFYSEDKLLEFCEKTGMTEFYSAAEQLISVWFQNGNHTELTEMFERFILKGGAYGNFKNSSVVKSAKNGGKLGYIMLLVFPKFASMQVSYPILRKVPVLLPLCYIYRFFEKIFGKKRNKAKYRYEMVRNHNDDKIKEAERLIKELKLGGRKK